jgi:class 3 adenylate cyclase
MSKPGDSISVADVAARAGVGSADVERMVALGILPPADGGFGPGAVRKVKLAMACERAGLPMDAIAESIREGRLSFAFLDAPVYERWADRSTTTYAEAAATHGIEFEQLRNGLESMGFQAMEPGDRIREDELEILPLIGATLRSGLLDEAWLVRIGRGYSEALLRLAQAENEVYHSRFEVPFLEQGLSQADAMRKASEMAGEFNALVDQAIMAMFRRQQELSWTEHLMEHIEDDLERTGRLGRPERMPAMAFVDLAGYTRLTDERGDQAAVEAASALAVIVDRACRVQGGTPVKWLGDGVMVAFREPTGAVRSALRLVDEVPRAGLPPTHIGIAAGRIVQYSGDYFGRTVNLAARLSGRARAGQVVVNREVVDNASTDPALEFVELPDAELKGFSAPINVFEARRAG